MKKSNVRHFVAVALLNGLCAHLNLIEKYFDIFQANLELIVKK